MNILKMEIKVTRPVQFADTKVDVVLSGEKINMDTSLSKDLFWSGLERVVRNILESGGHDAILLTDSSNSIKIMNITENYRPFKCRYSGNGIRSLLLVKNNTECTHLVIRYNNDYVLNVDSLGFCCNCGELVLSPDLKAAVEVEKFINQFDPWIPSFNSGVPTFMPPSYDPNRFSQQPYQPFGYPMSSSPLAQTGDINNIKGPDQSCATKDPKEFSETNKDRISIDEESEEFLEQMVEEGYCECNCNCKETKEESVDKTSDHIFKKIADCIEDVNSIPVPKDLSMEQVLAIKHKLTNLLNKISDNVENVVKKPEAKKETKLTNLDIIKQMVC